MSVREQMIEMLIPILSDAYYPSVIGGLVDMMMSRGVTIQRWIPVSERLPKKELEEYKRLGWDVYPCLAYLGTFVTKLFFDGKNFINIEGVSYTAETTHWMPMPEAPKEET